MLYFALLIAVAFYGVVYFVMTVMQPHLQRPTATLMWLRDLFFIVPDPNFYVVCQTCLFVCRATWFLISSSHR
jgi:hypothetical protein